MSSPHRVGRWTVLAAAASLVSGLVTPAGADIIPASGLTAWFKADSIGAVDGASVTTWADSDASPNNAASAGTAPTYDTGDAGSNNQPYVSFGGGTSRFRTAADPGINGDITTTVFVVFRPDSVASEVGNGVFFWGDPSRTGETPHGFGMLNDFDTAAAGSPQIQYGGGRRAFFTAGTETTSFQIAQVGKTPGAINATTTLRWDGEAIAIAGSPASNTGTPDVQTGRLIIGNWGDGLVGFNGDIAELIIYNRTLSEAEANQVGGYLTLKYGIETTYAIPEPASLSLLAAAVTLTLARRRA